MKYLNRWFVMVASAAFFVACSPAVAQWQTPDHSIPIGRGVGSTGFKSLTPGTSGLPLTSNGASADPTYQALGNSGLAQMPGNTVKCNPNGTTGSPLDCANPSTALVPDLFCTVDRSGSTDMGACINSAIAAAKSCNTSTPVQGYSRVYLRAGTYLITTPIVPKSCTVLFGDGPGKTVLLTNSNAPFGPPAGQQLVHFTLDNLTFKDSGTHPSAVVMTFRSLQDSRLTNLGFAGYTTGTLISNETSLVSSFDDSAAPWGGNSNIIFNYFLNWQADSCANCIMEAGHYGTNVNASPANSANWPDQVVTANRYDNIVLYNCSGKCIRMIKAADTEFFTNVYVLLLNNAVAVQVGDDPAHTGYNGVINIRMQITISGFAPTGTTFFQFGNFTFGNIFDVETDSIPGNFTPATVQSGVTAANYQLCGKNLYTPFADTYNTPGVCTSSLFYQRLGNGTSALPILGFANDSLNGLYLAATGTAGWSKNLRVDGHLLSGAASTPILSTCGTSPAFAGTASDTAGRVTVGSGPPTSCTITFGTAFNTAPVCVITPVGAPQQTYISAQSTTAITWSWATGAAGQQFNYACLALPGG